MRTVLVLASSLAAFIAARPAHAETPAPEPSPPRLWATGRVELLPAGAITSAPGTGTERAVDTATASAFSASIDYAPVHAFSIGLGARLIANVKPSTEASSGTQLDVLLRVTASSTVAPATRLFAVLAPGWSSLYVPYKLNPDLVGPRGAIIELSGGVARALGPQFAITFEAGYIHGFQGISGGGASAPLQDHYTRLAVGVSAALD